MLQQLRCWVMQAFFAMVQHCEGPYGRRMARSAAQLAATDLDGERTARPTARCSAVFCGSSKVRLWRTMKEDLAPYELLNRGFGGARSCDLVAAMEPLVLRHRPPAVVYYCGINDLHFGAQAEVPAQGLRLFATRLRDALPETRLLVLAMNLSPLHFALGLVDKIRRGNQLMKELADELGFQFVDLFAQEPRFACDTQLYCWDLLHLTPAGYQLLAELLKPHLAVLLGENRAGAAVVSFGAAVVSSFGTGMDRAGIRRRSDTTGALRQAWIPPGSPTRAELGRAMRQRCIGKHLLIYAGNQIGLSAFPQFIPLEDGKVTCQTDSFWPCQRSQVLKDEEDLPLGCQALRCTEEECCADAGTCAAFLNSSANATGCAEGYVPLHAPPEFCARPVCTSSDCCLRSAEPVGNLLLSFNTWDSIQVSWEVPQLHDCVFQEYQDAQGCQLKDSCGASCVARGPIGPGGAMGVPSGFDVIQLLWDYISHALVVLWKILEPQSFEASLLVPPETSLKELRQLAQQQMQVGIASLVTAGGLVLFDSSAFPVAELQGETLQVVARRGALCSNGYSRAFVHLGPTGSVRAWGAAAYGGELPEGLIEQLKDVQQVQHACAFFQAGAFAAIKSDGSVVTWGEKAFGGDSRHVQEQLHQIEAIQSSLYAFAALRRDGRVVAWGDPASGGHLQESLTEVIAIQATEKAFAAIKRDGTVVCWGDPARGGDCCQVQQALQQVRCIQAATGAFAAICGGDGERGGRVVCWGDVQHGGAQHGGEMQNVIAIQATSTAFAAILANGRVRTWGDRFRGGDSALVQDQLLDVLFLQSTAGAFAALTAAGRVVCWGDATRGGENSTLGNAEVLLGGWLAGAQSNRRSPRNARRLVDAVAWSTPSLGRPLGRFVAAGAVRAQLHDVVALQATFSAFCALKCDGTVVTWGDPVRGGDARRVQEELREVQQIQASGAAFAAIRGDGKVVTWGDAARGGDAAAVQEKLVNVESIQASTSAFAALRSDGWVVTWGSSDCGGDCRNALTGEVGSAVSFRTSDMVD
ncbi:Putative E3 ubiquitin-protein ligase HERC1 [Durusdinium trenchii]|uniref:E3 ubiquitin-protein ligase HERC1 n=1 Tax=Durusdinium trenchii TaxID=1381693 RepID=A0ABP0LU44_9DINO